MSAHRPSQQSCVPVQVPAVPQRHEPPVQTLPRPAQRAPQAPQSVSEVSVLTQAPSQHVRPPSQGASGLHAATHAIPRQTVPAGHGVGQSPPASTGGGGGPASRRPASMPPPPPASVPPPPPWAHPSASEEVSRNVPKSKGVNRMVVSRSKLNLRWYRRGPRRRKPEVRCLTAKGRAGRVVESNLRVPPRRGGLNPSVACA